MELVEIVSIGFEFELVGDDMWIVLVKVLKKLKKGKKKGL